MAVIWRSAPAGSDELGDARLGELEDDLERIAGAPATAKLGDLPGWLR